MKSIIGLISLFLSFFYNPVSVIQTLPAAPSDVVITSLKATQVTLSWVDNSENETGFYIYRSSTPSFGSAIVVGNVKANTTSFTDVSLTSNTTYYYTVASFNAQGESMASGNLISVITLKRGTTLTASGMPSMPSNLTIGSVTSSQVNLSWVNNATNQTGFKVFRSKSPSLSDTLLIGTVNQTITSFIDSGLSANTFYYYTVSAYNNNGNNVNPQLVVTQTLANNAYQLVTIPNPPSNVAISSIQATKVTINWTDNSTNEDRFYVYRSSDSNLNNAKLIFTTSANSTSYVDNGLNPNTNYYYMIASENIAGTTFGSSQMVGCTTANLITLPNPPSNVAISSIQSTQVTINWTDNSNNEDGFYVYRSSDSNLNNAKIIGKIPPNSTYYTDSGLSSNTNYYYTVASENSAGNDFANAAMVECTTNNTNTNNTNTNTTVNTTITGKLNYQRYDNIAGSEINDFTTSQISSIFNTPISQNGYIPDSGIDSLYTENSSTPNFLARIRGYIYVTVTDDYTFWSRADNSDKVFLSTDNTPGNQQQIIYVPNNDADGGVGHLIWFNSNVIHLVAGQKYYLEIWHKQGPSVSWVQLDWQTASMSRRGISKNNLTQLF